MFSLITCAQAQSDLLIKGTIDTLIMVGATTVGAYAIGLILAVLLYVSAPDSLAPCRIFHAVLGWVINVGRSIPFILLMVALIPVTRTVVGISVGVTGAIFPLIVSATPFVARMIEQSFSELDKGVLEAAQAVGARIHQIVLSVLIPESLPSIIRGLPIAVIAFFGYVAIAGAIGAGGLGDIAVRYGYVRHEYELMVVCIIVLVVLIQLIQAACSALARLCDHRS